MNSLTERLEKTEVEEEVRIPTLDGTAVAEIVRVKVPAWKHPSDGEIYFDKEAQEILDKTKARHMGLLSPSRIRQLRERCRTTQARMAQLFQLGEKTWTRWESGRERPSRSMNILLRAFEDGKIDTHYLESIQRTSEHSTLALGGVEEMQKLFQESLGSLYASSVTASFLSSESAWEMQIGSVVDMLRTYDRRGRVKSGTFALMLFRNELLSEGPNRVVESRTYGGVMTRPKSRLANEEVTA
jgi:DNA-binding transcriptional regulator YiaG